MAPRARRPAALARGDAGRSRPGPAAAAAGEAVAGRWAVLDFLRGCAIVAMIAYHFCFDLAFYGWLVADFGKDLRWIAFRTPILTTFLFVTGASLALATVNGRPAPKFWGRIALIAGAAALVSLGSYLMFPKSFIYFGVLHAIVVMNILARPLVRHGGWLIAAGAAVLIAGLIVRHPFFDQPAWQWIGLMTFKPLTEDYVPLFPWFGVMLAGVGCGVVAARHAHWSRLLGGWTVPGPVSWVAWLGRHSLPVYLVHQPILIGMLLLARQVLR